jgi:hypothetical protein
MMPAPKADPLLAPVAVSSWLLYYLHLFSSRWFQENPEAAVYEGRSPHLGRLRAIFTGDGRADAGLKNRESGPKRYLNKLLRIFFPERGRPTSAIQHGRTLYDRLTVAHSPSRCQVQKRFLSEMLAVPGW